MKYKVITELDLYEEVDIYDDFGMLKPCVRYKTHEAKVSDLSSAVEAAKRRMKTLVDGLFDVSENLECDFMLTSHWLSPNDRPMNKRGKYLMSEVVYVTNDRYSVFNISIVVT